MREWLIKLFGSYRPETTKVQFGIGGRQGVTRVYLLLQALRSLIADQDGRARHILSIAPLCLLLLICETSQAEPREAIELKKLVGQKDVDWEKLPGGWRSAGGSVLVQNGQYALVLVKTTQDWIPSKRVSGVLYLGRIAHDDAHMIADFIYCRDKPSTGLKPQLLGGRYREGRYRITAEVKFNRDACRRFYSGHEIRRAWRIDYDKGTFTPIDARGLVCEDILIGNEPSTKHCPQ